MSEADSLQAQLSTGTAPKVVVRPARKKAEPVCIAAAFAHHPPAKARKAKK